MFVLVVEGRRGERVVTILKINFVREVHFGWWVKFGYGYYGRYEGGFYGREGEGQREIKGRQEGEEWK